MNSPDNKDHHPNHQQHRSIHPPFPEPGSTIGPDGKFFCLGRLGKGTFCAIHKCVDLSYSHHHQRSSSSSLPPPSLVVSSSSSSQLTQSPTPKTADANDKNDTTSGDGTKSLVNISSSRKQRIVAAKVELANFVDSGVIDGEASVLKFLDVSLPDGMVPIFVDYVRQPPPSTTLSASATSSSSSAEATVVTPGTTIMDKSSSAATSADGGLSAIIMEHLPGEDMHLLRDRHCQTLLLEKSENGLSSSITSGAGGGGAGGSMSTGEKVPRRLSIQDSVYLVAEVMLPLLKAMHEVGMVHRDVKPSNVVRTGTTPSDRKFKIVDFGLSKSFVVPKDSSFADASRPWNGQWMSPSFSKPGAATTTEQQNNNTIGMMEGCVRIERESAEFRGTSMYASLRVHQGKDHCPRDDIWGLLYVFCDLVSGGLPWMGYASARDRTRCQIIKEMVAGERGRDDWEGVSSTEEEGKLVEGMATKANPDKIPKNGEDAIEWLLFGAEYHNAKYKRDMKLLQALSDFDPESLPPLPEPLALAKNDHYVNCLRKAFRHVASLGFVEMPDYELIGNCLRGFLDESDSTDSVPSINWKSSKRRRSNATNSSTLDNGDVTWKLLDEVGDPLDDEMLVEAEIDRRAALEAAAAAFEDSSRSAKGGDGINGTPGASALDPGASLTGEAADLARLPLQLQFYLSQVEYNARHPETILLHLALRDWMTLAVPLAHGKWDTAAWERGNHRTDDDGYRNEVYMSLLRKCLAAAEPFKFFSDRECYYYPLENDESTRKRRRVCTSAVPHLVSDDSSSDANNDGGVTESPLVVVSRVFFSLRLALELQQAKNFAPPPKLSFSYAFGRA